MGVGYRIKVREYPRGGWTMRPTGGMDRGKARLHLIYCYRAVDNPGEWVCGSKKLPNICWQPSWCSGGWAWGIHLCFWSWSSGRHGLWLSRVYPSRGYLPNLGTGTQWRNGERRPWRDGLWKSSDTWTEVGEASCNWCSVAALVATLRIRLGNRDNGEGPSLGSLPGTWSSIRLFLSLNWVFARGGGWDTTKRKKSRWGFEIHKRCGQWGGEAGAIVLLQHLDYPWELSLGEQRITVFKFES